VDAVTDDALADALVPIAARLVGTVREYGPDDVRAILETVPDGRYDALAVVLAAMVDPDSSPKELLGWTRCGLEYHRLVAAGVNARAAAVLAAEKVDR
jgi:hypothetical protein